MSEKGNPQNKASRLKAHLGIDYGTSSIKIRFTTYVDGSAVQAGRTMYFDDRSDRLPAAVAWYNNGTFYFGNDLQDRVRAGEVPAEAVIQCSKVAIHFLSNDISYADAKSATFEKVDKQIKDAHESIDTLLKAHLKGIILMAADIIKKDQLTVASFQGDEIPDPVIFVRLTIPQMWTAKATEKMYRALPTSLVKNAVLAREPQCAVAAYFDRTENMGLGLQLASLKKDDTILVNDLGCGTGDVVLYQLKDKQANIASRLLVLGGSRGALCGSYRINELVLKSILNELGTEGEDAALHFLGDMSKGAFRWHLLDLIEKWKVDPEWLRKPIYVITATTPCWNCQFPMQRSTMDEAEKLVIDEIIAMNQQVLGGRTPAAVLLLGGFSSNPQLQTRFEKEYTSDRTVVCTPKSIANLSGSSVELLVAHGALSKRYGDIMPQKLPKNYVYAFLQDENFNVKKHRDCTTGRKKNRTMDEKKLVKNEVAKTGWLAPDRLIKILLKTNDEARVAQEYVVCGLEPMMEKSFIYLDHDTKLKNGDAARQAPPAPPRGSESESLPSPAEPQTWAFKQGVYPWVTVKANLSPAELEGKLRANIRKGGVRSVKSRENTELLKFRADMIVTYKAEREVVISWDIVDSDEKVLFQVEGEQSLWDGARSVFVEDDIIGDTSGRVTTMPGDSHSDAVPVPASSGSDTLE